MNSLTRLIGALAYRERMRWRYYGVRVETWLVVKAHVSHGIRHTILRPAFWIGLTLGFPLEHLLWEKLWPFDILTRWLGL